MVGKRVRAWWRTDATGAVVLTVHYGAKPIEFERGKAAIAVGKKNKLIPTIETVIAAVEAGELDGVLARMSKTAVMTRGKRALIPIVVACDRSAVQLRRQLHWRRVLAIIILNRPRRLARTTMERLQSDRRPSYRRWSNVDKSGTSPMRDNDTRSNDGRGAVRLENDRICMFERDGIYQARIRTEANRYLSRSLRTRNQSQSNFESNRDFHSQAEASIA